MRLLTVFICIVVFSFQVHAEQGISTELKSIKPEITCEMQERGRSIYDRLMEIRKEPDFIQYGFDGFKLSSSHEKYDKWFWDANDLQHSCTEESQKIINIADRIQSELSRVCIAINYLNQMGQHYARNSGSDDKFTLQIKPEVKEALKLAVKPHD